MSNVQCWLLAASNEFEPSYTVVECLFCTAAMLQVEIWH
jgi:hypothetical protein